MSKRKQLGAFYTPRPLVKWMVNQILSQTSFNSALEPSCGDGMFLKELECLNLASIVSIDIDESAIQIAKKSHKNKKTKWFRSDFLFWDYESKFDLIIGNPPYVQKKLLSQAQAKKCREIHVSGGLADKEISNIWTSFIVKSSAMLTAKGCLAFVLPAEFLQVKYAEEIRNFVLENFKRVEVMNLRNFKFDDTEQNTVVLLAYKETAFASGLYFGESDDPSGIGQNVTFKLSRLDKQTKWSAFSLTEKELKAISEIRKKCHWIVDDFCKSTAGIVPAANSYFIISCAIVREYDLDAFVKPIIQRGILVNGSVEFSKRDFEKIKREGHPCFLLDTNGMPKFKFTSGLNKYLKEGIKKKIHQRYKCQIRGRWFDIPSIWKSEGFFFKRANSYPKLIANNAGVYVTDSAYRIQMKRGFCIENLIFSFYNSFTLLMAEIMGRSYGGGVLELTPNEFKNLPLPYFPEFVDFKSFSQKFLKKQNIEDILLLNDKIVLKSFLGVKEEDLYTIRKAYAKIKQRRLGVKNGNS